MVPLGPSRLLLVIAAAALGGAVNAIAGGGTLLTFPALVALGIPPIVANATSTVALVPGTVGALVGYRDELAGAKGWALRFAVPSLLGGLAGAILLIVTPAEGFDAVVPWLVLGATALFVVQKPLMRWLARRTGTGLSANDDPALRPPPMSVLLFQFAVALYGGYFGAGIGILMIAMLGLLGLGSIHRLNAVKNSLATVVNGIATAVFAAGSVLGSHDVSWPHVAVMAICGMAGSLGASRVAAKLPAATLRRLVAIIGFALAGYYFWRQWRA